MHMNKVLKVNNLGKKECNFLRLLIYRQNYSWLSSFAYVHIENNVGCCLFTVDMSLPANPVHASNSLVSGCFRGFSEKKNT